MIKNYLKIAWRNLKKNKIFSLINILGLTIGITVCMMIFLFIMNEFSFDSFHKDKKNIYRVMRGYDVSKPSAPYLSGPYATALLNDFPGKIKKAAKKNTVKTVLIKKSSLICLFFNVLTTSELSKTPDIFLLNIIIKFIVTFLRSSTSLSYDYLVTDKFLREKLPLRKRSNSCPF